MSHFHSFIFISIFMLLYHVFSFQLFFLFEILYFFFFSSCTLFFSFIISSFSLSCFPFFFSHLYTSVVHQLTWGTAYPEGWGQRIQAMEHLGFLSCDLALISCAPYQKAAPLFALIKRPDHLVASSSPRHIWGGGGRQRTPLCGPGYWLWLRRRGGSNLSLHCLSSWEAGEATRDTEQEG